MPGVVIIQLEQNDVFIVNSPGESMFQWNRHWQPTAAVGSSISVTIGFSSFSVSCDGIH